MIRKTKALKRFLDAKLIRLSIASGIILTNLVQQTAVAKASSNKDVFDFLKDGKSNGAFDKINTTIEETGYSGYNLLMTIGVLGLVFSFIILGINYAFTKNSSKKSENKSQLGNICIAGIFIFGALTLAGLIKSITDKINV